jgi:hypothetical protein
MDATYFTRLCVVCQTWRLELSMSSRLFVQLRLNIAGVASSVSARVWKKWGVEAGASPSAEEEAC